MLKKMSSASGAIVRHIHNCTRLWKSDDVDVEYEKVDKGGKGDSCENTFILRINCKHPSNSQLQCLLGFVTGLSICIICSHSCHFVLDQHGDPHHLCLVSYRIPLGCKPVV